MGCLNLFRFSLPSLVCHAIIIHDTMTRVKIKRRNSHERDTKKKLLELLATNNIYVIRIITISDGYIVLTDNDNDCDKLFQKPCLDALHSQEFQPIMPPELRAKRTVVIFKTGDDIIIQQ